MINKAYRTISYDANLAIAGVRPIDLHTRERVNIKEDMENEKRKSVSKRSRRRETLDFWQGRWDNSTKGRKTYNYIPNIWERMDLSLNTNRYTTDKVHLKSWQL